MAGKLFKVLAIFAFSPSTMAEIYRQFPLQYYSETSFLEAFYIQLSNNGVRNYFFVFLQPHSVPLPIFTAIKTHIFHAVY